jgi:hypothetical protein
VIVCVCCGYLRIYSVLSLNSMEWHGIRGQYVVYAPLTVSVPSIIGKIRSNHDTA